MHLYMVGVYNYMHLPFFILPLLYCYCLAPRVDPPTRTLYITLPEPYPCENCLDAEQVFCAWGVPELAPDATDQRGQNQENCTTLPSTWTPRTRAPQTTKTKNKQTQTHTPRLLLGTNPHCEQPTASLWRRYCC